MATRLNNDLEGSMVEEMRRGTVHGRGFKAFLTLLMLARPDRDLVKRICTSLEAQDLVAVRFGKRDLSSVSFRRADLSHATFSDCDLTGARFEGSFLSQTRFEGNDRLLDAQFGDLSRIDSIWVGRKLLDAPDQIRAWIAEATGRAEAPGEPCPTALQVARLFRKFITPLGQARRDELKRDALLAGKRFDGAASTEACLEDSVRHSYLTGPDHRHRFRRAEGDKYAEMVTFVREGRTSDGIGRLIAGLCSRRGCMHQLKA